MTHFQQKASDGHQKASDGVSPETASLSFTPDSLRSKYMANYIYQRSAEASMAVEAAAQSPDPQAVRCIKYLNLPDLSREADSPVGMVVDRILQVDRYQSFDRVEFPEVVSVRENFDLLNAPVDHPSRRSSDTYYLEGDQQVLRTQTTTMWPFYLQDPTVRDRLFSGEELNAVSFGKVFRKDEIDRYHYPVFHQIDGLSICERAVHEYTTEDLVEVLVEIAKGVYGEDVRYRVEKDQFPFTDPSVELQIEWNGQWLEVLGAGIVHTAVLDKLGIDSEKYNGWAFGFGLDRLAMIKMNIPDVRILWSTDERITSQWKSIDSVFEPVSKFPSTTRDMSILLDRDRSLNEVYQLVRDVCEDGGGLPIEEVSLIDTYENPKKFGPDRVSYTFSFTYRSHERTLTTEEVNAMQQRIRDLSEEKLGATLR